jgi:hypothetical protein
MSITRPKSPSPSSIRVCSSWAASVPTGHPSHAWGLEDPEGVEHRAARCQRLLSNTCYGAITVPPAQYADIVLENWTRSFAWHRPSHSHLTVSEKGMVRAFHFCTSQPVLGAILGDTYATVTCEHHQTHAFAMFVMKAGITLVDRGHAPSRRLHVLTFSWRRTTDMRWKLSNTWPPS